jgi:hypothetical protein
MDKEHGQIDPVERLLVELREAEQAGVFRRTRSDAGWFSEQLVGAMPSRSVWKNARVMSAIAAVFALAVGVWSTMFYWQIGGLRERVRAGLEQSTASATKPSDLSVAEFVGCLSGPGGSGLSDDCRQHDRDRNGRIDLREVSALQLAYSGSPRR